MLSAYDFAKRMHPITENSTSFGIDPKATADTLRRLADAIDPPQPDTTTFAEVRLALGLSRGCVYTVASRDGYARTTLRLTFHELQPAEKPDEPRIVELKGADKFPDDAAVAPQPQETA